MTLSDYQFGAYPKNLLNREIFMQRRKWPYLYRRRRLRLTKTSSVKNTLWQYKRWDKVKDEGIVLDEDFDSVNHGRRVFLRRINWRWSFRLATGVFEQAKYKEIYGQDKHFMLACCFSFFLYRNPYNFSGEASTSVVADHFYQIYQSH